MPFENQEDTVILFFQIVIFCPVYAAGCGIADL